MSDYIKREDAIKQIVNTPIRNQDKGQEYLEGSATRQNEIIDILNDIPSVAPSRPKGRWVDADGKRVSINEDGIVDDSCYCTECKEWLTASDEYSVYGNFCPNCGADMRGRKENE